MIAQPLNRDFTAVEAATFPERAAKLFRAIYTQLKAFTIALAIHIDLNQRRIFQASIVPHWFATG